MDDAKKVKVGAVNYLNTLPLIGAMDHRILSDQMELLLDYPASLAARLQNNEIDLGLIPVAMIPFIPHANIISDYCISTEGEVASVCLFSNVPIEKATRILLDYQSRTSVALTKILLKLHWKLSPQLVPAVPGYESNVFEDDAALIIGDRALEARSQFQYVYDLGLAWKALTGLPFVFAAWVANKQLSEEFIYFFNNAISDSLEKLPETVKKSGFTKYDMLTYYTHNIHYKLDDKKREAMALFLDYIERGYAD